MNILLLGSGGRESALAWKIAQSPLCDNLFIAPGNAGTQQYGENVTLAIDDFESIGAFCIAKHIDFLIPGGEDALVGGIFDYFQSRPDLQQITVVGPSQDGARLEGSKAFAKEFMQRHRIPTATYRAFDLPAFDDGVAYLQQHSLPVVIKADGLAAGKGVVIAHTTEEAIAAFTAMLKESAFGRAGHTVVVEQFLEGIECSVFVLTDGSHFVQLPVAKDYKRIGNGDTGPNTGGMGAVSPVAFADDAFLKKVNDTIIEPTIQGLISEGIRYQGFIFFGLIRVGDDPFVIEYNCRMGDPETEVVMPRLQNDLLELLVQLKAKKLNEARIAHSPDAACTVMLVSGGYPANYEKGKLIAGLGLVSDSILFHAGTKKLDEKVLTNGGRVIAVTAQAPTLMQALDLAYQDARKITFEGKNFRTDIGFEFTNA